MTAEPPTDAAGAFTDPFGYEAWFRTPLGAFVDGIEADALEHALADTDPGVIVDVGAGTGHFTRLRAGERPRMSHDEAEELDRGNPAELAGDYVKLNEIIPDLRVVGGCCGTDHEHVAHIAAAVV